MITKAVSMQWTRRFCDVGSFELHLPFTDTNLKYIKKDYFISHNGNYGIILYLEQTTTGVKVCGYDLKGLLKKRKCEGGKFGAADAVIKFYVSDNLVEATDPDRNISNFAVVPSQNIGDTADWLCKDKKLDIEVNKLCLTFGFGYDIKLINGVFTFDVCEGIDRTTSQTIVPPVTFSKQFKNISDFGYIKDDLTSYNVVYVATTKIYNTLSTGLDRSEGIEDFEGTAEEVLTKGKLLLTENNTKESVSTTTNYRLKYKTDWDLGDTVTLKVDVFGETLLLDKQVTEVLEVYERGNITITPTLGEVKNSIIKRLMRG